jgi:sulfoxide reductase heme-binding subunit YedZ
MLPKLASTTKVVTNKLFSLAIMPVTRKGRPSWLKGVTFALMVGLAARFFWQAYVAGDYGMFPIALGGMTFWSGVWATVILLAALAVTPAAKILRWPSVIDVRRMIGVTALLYTLGHVVIYFALRMWNFTFILNEVVTQLSLILATLSTVGLIALGVTSTDGSIRRMGAANWQRLHSLTYIISALALLHVVLARGTYTEQYALAGVFVWLMVWRLLARRGRATDPVALVLLTVGCAVFAALLEAGFLFVRRGYELSWTLGNNFNPAMLDVFVPPAWQVLVMGLAVALAAAGYRVLRPDVKRGTAEGRGAGVEKVATFETR